MSTRTVVVVSDDGRLVDAAGTPMESDSHYKKFAGRLLGDNSLYGAAVIDYSWNGRNKLVITGAGGIGSQIKLDASEVVLPSTLKIGGDSGPTLGELLSLSETKTLHGIEGTAGQIVVDIIENASPAAGQPDTLCVLKLSQTLLDKLANLEAQVSGMLRFDDIYYAGDGLEVDHVNKRIGVRLGTGLTFEEVLPGSDSPEDASGSDSPEEEEPVKAIAVDLNGIIEAVEAAIAPVVVPKYVIGIDSTTENAILYRNDNS